MMQQKKLLHMYRKPAISEYKKNILLNELREKFAADIADIETEYCFNIDAEAPISKSELEALKWLLSETFEPGNFSSKSFLTLNSQLSTLNSIFEVGPRMNFTTAWSSNAVSICHACGLTKINRIERSRRYKFVMRNESEKKSLNSSRITHYGSRSSDSSLITHHSSLFYDRMTECLYPEPLKTFETGINPEPVKIVQLLEEGKQALYGLIVKWVLD